jgi:predicted phosphodiesterase
MKRLIKTLLIVILLASVYSLIPLADLYIKKDPAITTNADAVAKLNGNKGEYFEFIVFGDNHAGLFFNDSAALREIKHINREDRFKKVPIDFVMIAGDITFRGSAWDYRIFNKTRSLIKYPVICAIGNHDDDNDGLARFDKYVGQKEFSFTNRNSYFIVLDNISGDLGDAQFAYLEEELKRSQAYKHRFVIMHKPPRCLYFQSWYRPELSEWPERFMKMCEKYKVDIVLSGHEHMSKEATFNGVKYITSGGGGIITNTPGSEGGFLHYMVVRVFGDYVDYEVRQIYPPFWELVTFYWWKEAVYFVKDAIL